MLLAHALEYQLDLAVFLLLVAGGVFWAHRYSPANVRDIPHPRAYFPSIAALVLGASVSTYYAGENERAHLRDMLQGLAPTFANEMEMMGQEEHFMASDLEWDPTGRRVSLRPPQGKARLSRARLG